MSLVAYECIIQCVLLNNPGALRESLSTMWMFLMGRDKTWYASIYCVNKKDKSSGSSRLIGENVPSVCQSALGG